MSYATRTDVERMFGKDNIAKYADLDNDKDTAKIEAQVQYALDQADEEINSRLRGCRYVVPFVGLGSGNPPLIIYLAAIKAGLILYEARGAQEIDADDGSPQHRYAYHNKRFDQVIKDIKLGRRTIDAVYATETHAPQVILDDEVGLLEATGFETFE